MIAAASLKSLSELEQDIEEGIQAYRRAGRALKEIRDRKLYRAAYRGFNPYVEQRWKRTRQWAYELIKAATVADELEQEGLPAPDNVTVALTIRRVKQHKRNRVWKDCVETVSQPTSRDVKNIGKVGDYNRTIGVARIVEAVMNDPTLCEKIPEALHDMQAEVLLKRIAERSAELVKLPMRRTA